MSPEKQEFRWLATRLPADGRRGVVVLTGARRTGKTTLARRRYPALRYLNLDSIEERETVRSTPTAAWANAIGPAVVDEAQKEPEVFDKVKSAYDEGSLPFSALLGSSRILLLDRVRETLAGRAFLYELWPLMLSEIRSPAGETPEAPLLDRLLSASAPESFAGTLAAEPPALSGEEASRRLAAFEHLSVWGGMPELLSLDAAERRDWLRSYQLTWLERGLDGFPRIADRLPFRTLQRLVMLRTAELLHYAELARQAELSAATVRRYLEYLRLSYQVVLLPPYGRNLTSATVKTPKIHWTDLGLLRHGIGASGPLTGPMFETLVVSETHKWIETMGRDAQLWFYRTRSGREVDLLITVPSGVIGIEVKNRSRVVGRDASALRALATALDREWVGGLVVHRGEEIAEMEPGIWAVPAHRLF